MVLPLVMAGIAVAGAGMQMYGASQSAAAQKEAGSATADVIMEHWRENDRRQRAINKDTIARGEAATYASGIQMSGSNLTYLQNMQMEQRHQLAWAKKAARSRAIAARKGASMSADATMISGMGSAAGTVAGGISSFVQTGGMQRGGSG